MRSVSLVLLSLALACGPLFAQTTPSAVTPPSLSSEQRKEILKRSLVAKAETARLARVFAKAERGERILVGVIGGSITQGAKATTPEKRYGNLVAQWWRDHFPKAEVTLLNAGIGATGSNFGALRARRDLLSKYPDFVIVEYSCNESDERQSAVTMEGLVRQILQAPTSPAVMMLFMTRKNGTNAQAWHSKVGEHYHLPMVSFRDGIWPGCQSGAWKIEDFIADEVHPNDFGHELTAACIGHLLELARKKRALNNSDGSLPAPLFSGDFEFTSLQEANDLKPPKNQGWTLQTVGKDAGWHADQPGSAIEFELKGTSLLFMSHVIRGAMGKAEVQVDDLPPKTIDGWFPGTWGGYRSTVVVADGLDATKPHRVRVKLLEAKDAESTGNGFSIFGLGAAGVR
ncbi:MAG: GDSL-type esterase/lipase family protein [Chthoniobacter sp.]